MRILSSVPSFGFVSNAMSTITLRRNMPRFK